MSISTATDEHTEGDDDTSQESQPNEESSESDNEAQNENGGLISPDVHEITSDEEEECAITNDDESSNSSSNSNEGSEVSHQSSVAIDHKKLNKLENGDNESDIEEVNAIDPLNEQQSKTRPLVISDTRNLVDLASKQAHSNGDQKEPTVVIINTNSILSSKGSDSLKVKSLNVTSTNAQNICLDMAARGTTITPVVCKSASIPSNNVPALQPQMNILPSLTDDMFVVEAPSFIVPYVYEKPSIKPFREFVDKLGKEIEDIQKKESHDKLKRQKAKKEFKKSNKDYTVSEDLESDDESSDKPEEVNKQKSSDGSWNGDSSDSEAIDEKKTSVDPDKDQITLASKGASVKSDSYFDCSLGQFFLDIGLNLVQEYVQCDLLKQQQRKLYREKKAVRCTNSTEDAILKITQNLQFSKRKNAPYTLELKKCEHCSFKSESMLIMSHHLEAPHMKNNIYKCNTCSFEIRSPHDILFHMEVEHNIRGRLERAPAYQQCANCHFEDNSKTKLGRHLIACAKKFKPEYNLASPVDWEPPAKIPKMSRPRNSLTPYTGNFSRSQVGASNLGRPPLNLGGTATPSLGRPRGRPPLSGGLPRSSGPLPGTPLVRGGVMIMHNPPSGLPLANYPIAQNATPKISITPLPRLPQPSSSNHNSKSTFVICEICDGYIKDLEQLRNHMQWIHKVKIHPKMIYNRPPLNCQKCQFRFFTDQGLERHLLGSHGLVTSSMQEAANKGKDAGRCPICGRVYQWKLLNHVSHDHNMTLKPAHLSYKCTVCTATFGMYKQFENHVYSAHSVVAKRVIDKNKPNSIAQSLTKPIDSESLLKPLKINDEITIIPQSAKTSVSITAKSK